MVSATWLGVGGEEVREIKDETQVSRKSTCCATASEHTRKTGLGREDAENSSEFDISEHI